MPDKRPTIAGCGLRIKPPPETHLASSENKAKCAERPCAPMIADPRDGCQVSESAKLGAPGFKERSNPMARSQSVGVLQMWISVATGVRISMGFPRPEDEIPCQVEWKCESERDRLGTFGCRPARDGCPGYYGEDAGGPHGRSTSQAL